MTIVPHLNFFLSFRSKSAQARFGMSCVGYPDQLSCCIWCVRRGTHTYQQLGKIQPFSILIKVSKGPIFPMSLNNYLEQLPCGVGCVKNGAFFHTFVQRQYKHTNNWAGIENFSTRVMRTCSPPHCATQMNSISIISTRRK